MEFLHKLFSSQGFMPHGYCYFWNHWLVLLHVISDVLITLSYFSIPITLVYFARRRRDLPFHWMFLCFGLFIVACGSTHAMEVWTLWHATYWLSGFVKAITALASVPTAILLVQLVPKALAIPSSEQLAEMNLQLVCRTDELARTNAELAASNKELEAFSYSVSHDLRAPLRSINGFSLALLEDYSEKLDVEGRDSLQRVRFATQRMGELIDDLLNLARVTRTDLRPQKVDFSMVARSIASELQAALPERNVVFQVENGLQAIADPHLIRIALENLLGNAWKFTSKRSAAYIELGTVQNNGTPTYFVRDNGAGFEPAHAGRLFGAFQRLHDSSEFPGTGVGLATVQRIIHRHGGTIRAEGNVEKGATFYFTLWETRHSGV
jgi:signal transduction histidine kinase